MTVAASAVATTTGAFETIVPRGQTLRPPIGLLYVPFIPPSLEPQDLAIQDNIDSWIETNADRFELYSEDPAAPKVLDGSVRVRDSMVHNSAFWSETKEAKPSSKSRPTANVAVPQSDVGAVARRSGRVEKDVAARQISGVMKDLKFSAKCSRFVSENGFGPQGNQIISLLKSGKGDEMLEDISDIQRACPSWDILGRTEKAYVWVKIFATMSMKESSCDASASNHSAPDGKAKGLFQLNQGKESSYADDCRKGDSLNAEASTKCALSMINRQIEKDGKLKSNKSYFGVLRPKGDYIYSKKAQKKKYVKLTDMLDLGLSKLPFCHGK